MMMSPAAQPTLALKPSADATRSRIRGGSPARGPAPINVAALYRRALIRAELLLTIAAAPRPAGTCGH